MSIWVGLLLTVCAGSADANSLDGEPRFVAARDAFGAFELDKAKDGFAALSTDNNLAPGARAEATVWLGLTEAELGEFDAAEAAFARALNLDRGVALPTDASPKVVEMFRSVQGALPAVAVPTPPAPAAPGTGDTGKPAGALPKDPSTSVPSSEDASVPSESPGDVDDAPDEAEPFAFGPVLLLGGLGTSGFGVISVLAAGGLGAFALLARQQAEEARSAPETQAANELMLSYAAGANVLAAVGTGLLVTGASLLVGSIFGGW